MTAKANSFENLLDPFLKVCRLSKPITLGIAKSQFFQRLIERLNHSKAVVRLNLLKLLKAICDVHPNKTALVEKYGLYDIVGKLGNQDGAVLVRELAREIMPSLAPALKPVPSRSGKAGESALKLSVAPKRRSRRAASDALLPQADNTPKTNSTSRLQQAAKNRVPPRQKLGDISWANEAR